MATQIGPKIGIEGEKEYRAQIQQIINQTKTLDAAMNKTASTWDENTSAMTKNKAVAQNLVQQIELQRNKLTAMNHMLEESAEKFGENDTKTMAWKRAVDNTTASLNLMEQELKQLNGAEAFSNLTTQMADVGQKMQNIGQQMTAVGQKLTMSLTLPIVAAGSAAIKLGSDLEESANKVDVVFGNMSGSVREFAQTTTDAFAISEGKALEMAGDYGAMATSMGMSQQQAANLATEMVGLAGDMASFHNKSTEIAANSLKGVFTGETESLKQFGVAMTQTNLEDFAAKQGKVYDQMSQGEKIMTRYNYLLQSQGDAIGDASRTMDGFAGSTRQMKAELENAGAALGEALIPIITPIVQAITELLETFAELPAPIQKVIAILLALTATIGPIVMVIGLLMSSFRSIVTNAPMVASAIIKIGSAIAGVQVALGPAIAIILLFVAALAAIAAITYVVADNWDEICASVNDFSSTIKSAYDKVDDANESLKKSYTNLVKGIVDYIRQLPAKIVEALKEGIQKVKDAFNEMIQNAKQSGKDFIQGFVDGIKEKISKVVEAVKDVANTIKDFLGFSCPDKGPLHEYETWMPDFMQGLAKGIKSNMGVVKGAVNDVAKTMAVPLSSNASMNMAMASAGAQGSAVIGGTTMNVYVDHISELNDLIRIQNQAQQRYRMGAR